MIYLSSFFGGKMESEKNDLQPAGSTLCFFFKKLKKFFAICFTKEIFFNWKKNQFCTTWSHQTRQMFLSNPIFVADKRSQRSTNTFFLGISGGGLAIVFCSLNFMIDPIWNNFSHRE
jgi:hypothetical protein